MDDDFKCVHCRFFNKYKHTCEQPQDICIINEDEPEAEADIISKYDDVLPMDCSCGSQPIVKCSGGYYWVTCNNCRRTTNLYTDTLSSLDSGRTKAIKEWNTFNGGGR